VANVDDLRARLRELGYLDAGVDRFVLGAASGGRGLLAVASRASARIGVLAALLLGPSAAIALSARLPGLVTGARDAVVLTLYLSVLFGVAVALFAFVVSVLLGSVAARVRGERLAGRARLFGRAAGLLVGAGCLVYLVLWWRAVNPAGSIRLAGARTVVVLAWAAFVSALLGHAAHVTTLALIARGGEAFSTRLLPFRRRWATRAAPGLAAFLGAAMLLWATTRGEPGVTAGTNEPLVARPTGVGLTVVALDGVDLGLVERLRAQGRLPALGAILDGPRLRLPPSDAPDPARAWTSLATGMPPGVHGVGGIEARRVSGMGGRASGLGGSIAAATDLLRLTRPALTTGMERRVKTFWEVAAEAGLSSLVVNWWATWPADGPGAVLTDRIVLRLERGGALDAEVAPPSLYPRLAEAWPRVREDAMRRVSATFPDEGEPDATLRRAALQDALPIALASLLTGEPRDLEAVYLPGLDIAQYELLVRGGSSLPPSALAARVEAVERYYIFLDGVLGPLIRPDRLTALLTDPGRSPVIREGGESSGRKVRPALLVFSGAAPLRAGNAAFDGDRGDVLPTLLYAVGVPISRELAGRPATGLFEGRFVEAHPVRHVESYGRRIVPPRPAGAAPLDQEMLDRLRSLGYVR
jgi:hypothetical protein